MNNCKQCSCPISVRNKFCSKSCAAKFNNKIRTVNSRKRQSINLKKKLHPDIDVVGDFSLIYKNTCKECNNYFFRSKPKRYFCSKECLSLYLRKQYIDRPEISKENSRQGILKGIETRGLRSKQETELYELCAKYFQNTSHNEKIIDGWDADILLKDYKIAILWNGPWHYKQMPHKNHSLSQVQTRDKIKKNKLEDAGWHVLIYEDNKFTPFTAFQNIKMVVDKRIELLSSAYETAALPLS